MNPSPRWSRSVSVLCAALILTSPLIVAAQPEPSPPPVQAPPPAHPAPPPAHAAPPAHRPAPPPPGQRKSYVMTKKQVKRHLANTDPDYRSAKGMRLGGILVTTIGGGLGLVVGLIGGFAHMGCSLVSGSTTSNESCDTTRNVTITGFVTLGAALAIGIPLIVVGQGRMNDILGRHLTQPVMGMDINIRRGGATFGMKWSF